MLRNSFSNSFVSIVLTLSFDLLVAEKVKKLQSYFNLSFISLFHLFLEQLQTIVPDICNDGVFNADAFKYQHQ